MGPLTVLSTLAQLDAGLISIEEAFRREGIPMPPTRSRMPSATAVSPYDGLRTYPWQGRDLISATSLRQALGSPRGLVNWAYKEIAAHAIDNIEELAKYCIEFNGLIAAGKPVLAAESHEKTMKWLVKAATAKRDAAADKGRRIHSYVENETPTSQIPTDLVGYVRQERRAMEELGILALLREKTVFNLTLGYAGTFDLIGLKNGLNTMIDVKTGSGIYIDHAIQLALYYWGEFIGENDVRDEEATKILHGVEAMGILHLAEDYYEWIDVPISESLGKAVTSQAYLANFYAQFPDIAALPKGATE